MSIKLSAYQQLSVKYREIASLHALLAMTRYENFFCHCEQSEAISNRYVFAENCCQPICRLLIRSLIFALCPLNPRTVELVYLVCLVCLVYLVYLVYLVSNLLILYPLIP